MDTTKVKRLSRMINHTKGLGQSHLGRVFNADHTTISRVLRQKTEIDCLTKTKVPEYKQDQASRAVTAARRLATKIFKEKQIVMDDESYFYLSNTRISGNDVYYTPDKSTTPADVKFKWKTKFEDKVLIWAAISGNGLSDAYIHKSKNAINSQKYEEAIIVICDQTCIPTIIMYFGRT
jgi:hypothetical protein